MEKAPQNGERSLLRGLAERLVCSRVTLICKIALEGNRLLNMEFTEVSEFGINLKAMKSFGNFIERAFAIASGFLQISEISSFKPLVLCIVF